MRENNEREMTTMQISMSADDKAIIKSVAAMMGVSVSKLVRTLVYNFLSQREALQSTENGTGGNMASIKALRANMSELFDGASGVSREDAWRAVFASDESDGEVSE